MQRFFFTFFALCFSFSAFAVEKDKEERLHDLYRERHRNQTVEFAAIKKRWYSESSRSEMSVWQVMELLKSVQDRSKQQPISEARRALLFAESLHREGKPEWMVLTGLIANLGKVLCCFGEPQWAVVGETYPLGCDFSNEISFSEYFEENLDRKNSDYSRDIGIYHGGCGLDAVLMSWGHDEYLYQILLKQKTELPSKALYLIRYHSFYSYLDKGSYPYLTSIKDIELEEDLEEFVRIERESVALSLTSEEIERKLPYYRELVKSFLPKKLRW